MSRIQSYRKKVWVDGRGVEHDIKHMADDHIINCICFMERRKVSLIDATASAVAADKKMVEESEARTEWVEEFIKDCDKAIVMFQREMYRRHRKGIKIDREKAEEYMWNAER